MWGGTAVLAGRGLQFVEDAVELLNGPVEVVQRVVRRRESAERDAMPEQDTVSSVIQIFCDNSLFVTHSLTHPPPHTLTHTLSLSRLEYCTTHVSGSTDTSIQRSCSSLVNMELSPFLSSGRPTVCEAITLAIAPDVIGKGLGTMLQLCTCMYATRSSDGRKRE